MEAAVKILYLPEEQARQKIRNYVNEGLKDVQENAIYDFDEAFDELESRYKVEGVWCSFNRRTKNAIIDIGDYILYKWYGNGLTSVNDIKILFAGVFIVQKAKRCLAFSLLKKYPLHLSLDNVLYTSKKLRLWIVASLIFVYQVFKWIEFPWCDKS